MIYHVAAVESKLATYFFQYLSLSNMIFYIFFVYQNQCF